MENKQFEKFMDEVQLAAKKLQGVTITDGQFKKAVNLLNNIRVNVLAPAIQRKPKT